MPDQRQPARASTGRIVPAEEMPDLAPMIRRQRLVIEGTADAHISDWEIRSYLTKLTEVCDMVLLLDPVTHCSETYGWAGWVHWEASGAHFYAWDQPILFFTVDIFACKSFDAERVVEFTKDFFSAPEVVAKEV